MKNIVAITTAVIVGTAAMTAQPASAKELIYGSWLGAKSATNLRSMPAYFEAIKKSTNGEIEWKLVGGGQLASGPGTIDAVKNGLMDAGVMMAPYTPKEVPSSNLIFNQSLIGDHLLASVGAMNETLMLNCPSCHEEFRRNNAVGFSGFGVSPYLFMCRKEVKTTADLNGLKVRGSGAGVSIVKLAGGTPVAMPPNEATTALERGVLDCVLGGVSWLRNFGYMDVVKYVLDAPMGMGGPPVMMYMNRKSWAGLTPAQRKAHVDNAALLVAVHMFQAEVAFDQEVIEEAKKKGIVFHKGGNDFMKVMEQWNSQQRAQNIKNAADAGVKNGDAIVDAYLASYKKWIELMKGIKTQDEYQAAIQREIYSKIDPEKL